MQLRVANELDCGGARVAARTAPQRWPSRIAFDWHARVPATIADDVTNVTELEQRGLDAASDHRRQRAALLRGQRIRHSGRLRARIRRRLSLVGIAGSLFCPLLSVHHLQRAGLSAFGRADGWRALFARSR